MYPQKQHEFLSRCVLVFENLREDQRVLREVADWGSRRWGRERQAG